MPEMPYSPDLLCSNIFPFNALKTIGALIQISLPLSFEKSVMTMHPIINLNVNSDYLSIIFILFSKLLSASLKYDLLRTLKTSHIHVSVQKVKFAQSIKKLPIIHIVVHYEPNFPFLYITDIPQLSQSET